MMSGERTTSRSESASDPSYLVDPQPAKDGIVDHESNDKVRLELIQELNSGWGAMHVGINTVGAGTSCADHHFNFV